MPTTSFNLQFLNHNAQRKYPLTAEASGEDVTGEFHLPDDFLVGLRLPVHAGLNVESGRFFLYRLSSWSGGYLLVIGYQPSQGDAVEVASTLVARSTFRRGQIYTLGGIGDFADTVGTVQVWSLDNIDNQPAGEFTFNINSGRIEVDCIWPIIRGVSSVTVVNGSVRSPRLYGDLEFVAGTNYQFGFTPATDDANAQIRCDAIDGSDLADVCVCEDEEVKIPIAKINLIGPDSTRNFNVFGSACLEVESVEHGIRLKNTCAEPCCGPKELEVITATLQRLQQQASTLATFVRSLNSRATQIDTVVLGSKISDTLCG